MLLRRYHDTNAPQAPAAGRSRKPKRKPTPEPVTPTEPEPVTPEPPEE